jgi:inhibitor of cysteine peptidase
MIDSTIWLMIYSGQEIQYFLIYFQLEGYQTMRIKLLAFLIVFLTLFVVAGCSGGGSESYTDPSEAISVKINQEFVISLEANATTGYAWEAAYDEELLTLIEQNYVPDEHEEGMVGVGGTDHLRFKALQAGSTEIELSYKQPWDEDSEDDERLTFTVEIE